MVESNNLREIVQHAVERALADQLPGLQNDIVKRVLDALPSIPSGNAAPSGADAGHLLQAIASIHEGTTQKEILRALLDRGSAHCARIALFVVKAGAVIGWQGRGFDNDEGIKDFPLDLSAGPVSHAYHNRVAAPANMAEMDRHFVEQFGSPANEQVLVLPLVLKDKVAALVYADGGSTGVCDSTALELLVLTTGAWLEVVSLRKQSQRDGGDAVSAIPAPAQSVSSFADPFAGHAPKHTAAKAAQPEPTPEVVEVGAHAATASAAAAPAAATDPFAGLSPDDADTHRKAQRFARLLVDEIKLYNQAKVAEGRRNHDVYDRLKEDIEKSRSTYQKRYGNTAAASGDYFQKEVVRSLAEDDVSVMGANFRK